MDSSLSDIGFVPQLRARWLRSSSLLCVGLDPDPGRFPAHLRDRPDAIKAFCCAIVDATHDLACAFKPQIAYFASQAAEDQLLEVIDYIHRRTLRARGLRALSRRCRNAVTLHGF
jgi:orotidine-5'-phosphate decarboxylase